MHSSSSYPYSSHPPRKRESGPPFWDSPFLLCYSPPPTASYDSTARSDPAGGGGQGVGGWQDSHAGHQSLVKVSSALFTSSERSEGESLRARSAVQAGGRGVPAPARGESVVRAGAPTPISRAAGGRCDRGR